MIVLTKKCEVCSIIFDKPQNVEKKRWEKRRYCTRKCASIGYSNDHRILVDKPCLACGKTFRPASFGSKYCSPICAKHRSVARRGSNSWNWKGGRISQSGYVRVRMYPEHRFYNELAGKKDYVMEHRIIMSEMLGRAMLPSETVHHKNGVRNDNRPDNLELRTGQHGQGATNHCLTCTCE